MRESVVLEGVAKEAHSGQARRAAGGVQMLDMREGVLLPELADDAHIHVSQVPARRHRANPVFLVTTRTELARRAALAPPSRPTPSGGAAPHAAAHRRRDQRAPGVPLLPPHLLLLLLAEAALPGQARAVRHTLRLRVLSPAVPYQKLSHYTQEPPAPGLQRHAQKAAEDVGAPECPGTGSPPPVRFGRRARRAAAARPAMTTDHGVNLPRLLIGLQFSRQLYCFFTQTFVGEK